ncbi:MAG: hypothetical protein ACD_30C00074G0008 [uncultured bacterium]|nr:MAG: hypothetical protein ACD_30C00074G0008 [uncultured bacterium]
MLIVSPSFMWITSPLKSYTLMDTQKNWNKILDIIKNQVSAVNFKGWFSKTEAAEISDTQITIKVPSAFFKDQLILKYNSIIRSSVNEALGKDLKLNFIIDSTISEKINSQKKGREEENEDSFFSLPQSQPQPVSNLNSKFTLENFVVGLTNNLAYAAAQAVIQNPGISYNPLFIYGPSGVGKTHLMQAIGNALLKKNPYLKIIIAPSEKFMNDFVQSIQTKKMGDFRSKYRNCGLFLIDDVQFISGKDSTQEEFFHTFNEIHSKNLQIVLTSDKPPNEIQKLEPRLLSRFQGGLMVDIQLPDFDTRMAILKAKLTERGESLPEDILNLIAENIVSNTRELEGKLIQILQMSRLKGETPTLDSLKNILGKPQNTNSKLDHRRVLSTVNNYFNLKLADLTGPRRQKELVLPRQLAMYILQKECGLPLERIGEILGGRDHTTIMHGVSKIDKAAQRDREIQRLLIELKHQLTN